VQYHEALKRLRTVGLPVDHVHDLLLKFLALRVAARPAVARAAALLGDEDIFGIVEIGVVGLLDGVDDLRDRGGTLGSRSMSIERGM